MTTQKFIKTSIITLSQIRNSTQKFEDKNKAAAYISDLVDAGISFAYRSHESVKELEELQPLPTLPTSIECPMPNRNGSSASA
jgi:hypothetical protein